MPIDGLLLLKDDTPPDKLVPLVVMKRRVSVELRRITYENTQPIRDGIEFTKKNNAELLVIDVAIMKTDAIEYKAADSTMMESAFEVPRPPPAE